MENWKYKIGDFVNPVVMNGYEHATKMVVTARVTEEYANHVERYYICSHYKLGDYVRTRQLETELM
jgi:hypothetical protein